MRTPLILSTLVILSMAAFQMEAVADSRVQTAPGKAVPEFVDTSKNRIAFKGSLPDTYKSFFRRTDTLLQRGEGRLNIIYIGGSHVQGGMLTGRFRDDLLSETGGADGGFGIVFPFTAARTNTPVFYTSRNTGEWEVAKNTQKEPSRRLGLTGMAVTATDTSQTLSIVTKPRGEERRGSPFNKVEVCGYFSSDTLSGTADSLKIDLSVVKNILHEKYDGDSIYVFKLPKMADSICLHVPMGFTVTGIRLSNGHNGFTVSGIGVNGASLVSYERCEDFERDLRRNRPDMMIFGIGINDASGGGFETELFKKRYRRLVGIVERANPDCAMLFVTNNDSCIRKRSRGSRRRYYVTNPNGKTVREAFLSLGEEYDAGVWDLFEVMGGEGSMRLWEKAGLARRDKIHFTKEGYELLGDLLFSAIEDCYIQYKDNDDRP